MKRLKVSNNVIRRLPRYLRKLDELDAQGISRVSSSELGQQLGLTPSQIRQDFSCLGSLASRATATMYPASAPMWPRSWAWIGSIRPC